jgi:hypothetical protein
VLASAGEVTLDQRVADVLRVGRRTGLLTTRSALCANKPLTCSNRWAIADWPIRSLKAKIHALTNTTPHQDLGQALTRPQGHMDVAAFES